MFNVKPIVQRLKSYREERGIKQTDLAQRLGTSPATLSRWENGPERIDDTPFGNIKPAFDHGGYAWDNAHGTAFAGKRFFLRGA